MPMSTGRSLLSLVAADNNVHAIGGLVSSETGPTPSSLVEKYNGRTGKWTPMKNMNMPRSAMAAGVLQNGIFVMGGATELNSKETASVERFDLETEEWTMARRIKLK